MVQLAAKSEPGKTAPRFVAARGISRTARTAEDVRRRGEACTRDGQVVRRQQRVLDVNAAQQHLDRPMMPPCRQQREGNSAQRNATHRTAAELLHSAKRRPQIDRYTIAINSSQ